MKVYVVIQSPVDFSDDDIQGIYLSEHEAINFCDNCNDYEIDRAFMRGTSPDYTYRVEEWEVI